MALANRFEIHYYPSYPKVRNPLFIDKYKLWTGFPNTDFWVPCYFQA
jgi:hypothetical protein